MLYHGCFVEDGVFLGPGVILTNDKLPRAINPDGSLKLDNDWIVGEIVIRRGASLGARSVVLPDVEIGEFAMVGAGAVVTKDVPAHGLVMGTPAVLRGFVCRCGRPLKEGDSVGAGVEAWCDQCEQALVVGAERWP
jgi:acetyltransferase-like isoleucine patch superfamily enzyme